MKCAQQTCAPASQRWLWLLGCLGLWLLPAWCPAAPTLLPYNVRLWQTDDGLPQSSVCALAQTLDGYLWVGTREGLARFDGERFTVVDEPAAPELKHGWITTLCAGTDGSLWIGVEGSGLTRVKAGVFAHFTEAQGVPLTQPRCLLEAPDGSLWIGCEAGLAHYQLGRFTALTDRQGLRDNSVRGLCLDPRGVLHMATKRGLCSLEPTGRISGHNIGATWNANALRCVLQDHQGRLWVGATDGLNRLVHGEHTVYRTAEGLPDKVINCVLEDHAGQLWVGTYSGLSRIVDGKIVAQPDNETAFDMVNVLFEDREENLWVGGRDGLFRLTPARFTTYTMQQGLTHNNVMSVCEDSAGTVWLGIWDGGLNALRDGKVTAYGPPESLTRDSVLSLHPDRRGGLWIGMEFDAGLNRLIDGRRVAFPRPSGLLNAPIRAIHEDHRGALWVGTSRGLNILHDGQVAVYTSTNGLGGENVLALWEDTQGRCWVGTDGGLSCWTGSCFVNYTTAQGLSHNVVNAIYEDSDHTFWLGTRGGGLNRFKAGKFAACGSHQGLFSDEIYEILEDDFGFFWMSCRRGIFRVAKKDVSELLDGGRSAITCTAFGKADGLLSVQCNGVAKPSGWKGHDGRLWFPTIRGVVAVECRIKPNDKPPPVVIEAVLADQREVKDFACPPPAEAPPAGQGNALASVLFQPWTAALRLPPGHGELEIQYTALSLQAPEKNRFKYRLEGADSGWIDAGASHVAHYYNLAPGRYRFQVIGCNNDGVWNLAGASLALVLAPHAWQTWWFKAALALSVGLVLTLVYRARVNRLQELERLRVEIAANLHDDVGSRLTKVAMIAEQAEQETLETDRLKPHIRTLFQTTRDIIQAMDEIVWTINPKNDSLDNLANYIFQYAQEYFQDTGVRCRLDVPAQLPESPVSTETRHSLFMAIKEALNNVLKHARAGEVWVGVAVADGRIRISIADNGCGFAPEAARAGGNGLGNMRARLERLGGRFSLETQPGQGTRLTLEAPLG